ncbi:MAG: hypothetical protein AB7O95_14340 [Geminicoccaceae bacterium]
MISCLTCGWSISAAAQAVPTLRSNFHTLSIYWTRSLNAQGVAVRYRPLGSDLWLEAQNLWRDDASPLAQYRGQYRGSIVNLAPNTAYEVAYSLDGGGSWSTSLSARTRPETFAGTIVPYSGTLTQKLVISTGGTTASWRIIDGQNRTVIDPGHRDDCVQIKASYVVLRNFKLEDCRFNGILVEKPNVVIEGNMISDWGIQEIAADNPAPRKGNVSKKPLSDPASTCIAGVSKSDFGRVADTGIMVKNSGNQGIVIQRNVIRDPRYRSTRWVECPGWDNHPWGPRAINIVAGTDKPGIGNVIRYNDIYATNTTAGAVTLRNDANRYYDVVGVNFGQDLDVYGNVIRNGTDDVVEADNAAINVRIWGNYLDSGLSMISLQLMQAGPAYIFRNVFDRGADIKPGNPGTYNVGVAGSTYGSASPLKLKQNNGGTTTAFLGPVYIYHNTSLRPDLDGFSSGYGISGNSATKEPNNFFNIISVNNVFMTAANYLSDTHPKNWVGYRFSDMYNRPNRVNATYLMTDGLYATAVWKTGHGPSATWAPAPAVPSGRYQIVNAGEGVPLPNFNDEASRGRGAQQYRADQDGAMGFGRSANWTYRAAR